MNEMAELHTSMNLRAWKVSDAEEIMGARTACTSERAFGTQVSTGVL